MLGSVAINGESFLRSVEFLTGDKPDEPKARADQCGKSIGDWLNESTCDVEAILWEVAAAMGWPSEEDNVGTVSRNNITAYYWVDRSAITRASYAISIVEHPSHEEARAEVDNLIKGFKNCSSVCEITIQPGAPRSRYKS